MTLDEHKAALEETIAAGATMGQKPAATRRHLEGYIRTFALPLVVVEAPDGTLAVEDALDPVS